LTDRFNCQISLHSARPFLLRDFQCLVPALGVLCCQSLSTVCRIKRLFSWLI
jgi:hypothetical protein